MVDPKRSVMASGVRASAIGRAPSRLGARASTARHISQQHSTAAMAARIDRHAGAASPAESVSSAITTATAAAGAKRKERDFESSDISGEETHINVFVRCRRRNERELRENSAVVVETDSNLNTVNLSMGPNALSNKTYNFDRVFSPAADQSMIFDAVVKPILEEASFPKYLERENREAWGLADCCD